MDPINTSPVLSGNQMPPVPEKPKSSVGPVAGAVIVILLLIAGGLYFWGAQLNKQQELPPYIPSNDTTPTGAASESTVTSDSSAGLPAQHESDDVSSIEADANAIDLDSLDKQNNAQINNI